MRFVEETRQPRVKSASAIFFKQKLGKLTALANWLEGAELNFGERVVMKRALNIIDLRWILNGDAVKAAECVVAHNDLVPFVCAQPIQTHKVDLVIGDDDVAASEFHWVLFDRVDSEKHETWDTIQQNREFV